MKFNKKGFAVLLALSLGMSGAALAASADSFSDVPKDHWSYEALDYLAKEGVIEGMGNSTFEGGRTMTRYEVASIVAKAMQKGGGNFGDKTVLEKLHAEYADEINVLQQQVAKNCGPFRAWKMSKSCVPAMLSNTTAWIRRSSRHGWKQRRFPASSRQARPTAPAATKKRLPRASWPASTRP